MLNTHYLQYHKHDRVFVECSRCGHLVAKYILRNYLDPVYHCEQILKLAKVTKGFSSGRKTVRSWQNLPEKARGQFRRVKELLEEGGEEVPLEELFFRLGIVEDDYPNLDE
ncbi:MAG: hypothetical protein GX751_12260 [Desulfuromonadaceae bacterium]|nr:hypothetical protein [Desulfuromonadaceae bacterium]